jgi:hypothetical protein
MRNTNGLMWTVIAVALAVVVAAGVSIGTATAADDIVFTDVAKQGEQFMAWERSIKLTPAQEAIKKEALEAIPAPCCSDNTAYTCCCPCNMSRSIWGLSNYLIAEKGADVATVRARAEEWIAFMNPDGFSGDVCYTGGCNRAVHDNGCGGMGGALKP